MKVSRRRALQLLAGSAAGQALAQRKARSRGVTKDQPNVVLVLLDDVGYGDLACHGNPYIKTPNIDALHERSVRLTNYHGSPTCAPTRAALMTGRYSDAVGVWHTIMGRSLLDPGETTMGDCFRAAGYRTGLFGKWHLGDNYPCRPQDRGFDESLLIGGGGLWQTPDYFGNDDFNDTYRHNGDFQKYDGYSTDVWFQQAFHFMEKSQKIRKPFFCFIPTPAAHEPTWSKPEDEAPYVNVPRLKSAGFYGMIVNLDQNIGRLVQFLEQQHLTENTILIFSTDNGSIDGFRTFNAGMRAGKGSPYDGGHRLPMFFYWPNGQLGPTRDVDTLTAHIDLLPTLMQWCGLQHKGKPLHGRSLDPLLRREGTSWPERTIMVDSQREETIAKWRNTSVMTQQWRLVNTSKDYDPAKSELYAIAVDPGQKTDVAAQHPDVVQRLRMDYDAWWNMVSARGDWRVPIVLGNRAENPSTLTCMDWHGDANSVWNQRQIRGGPVANGLWTVAIDRPGRYRFEARRWPREVNLPINAPYVDQKSNREEQPGMAISAVKARLEIHGQKVEKPVKASDVGAVFEVQLPTGESDLRAVFTGNDGAERGAYYLYAERIG